MPGNNKEFARLLYRCITRNKYHSLLFTLGFLYPRSLLVFALKNLALKAGKADYSRFLADLNLALKDFLRARFPYTYQ